MFRTAGEPWLQEMPTQGLKQPPMRGWPTGISRDHKMNITIELDPEMQLQPLLPGPHQGTTQHIPVQGILIVQQDRPLRPG